MIDLIIVPCIAIGFILGTISGLTPGLHVNNFASMLLALSPLLMEKGLLPYHIASMILAASISQTFFDTIPAIFVGAPDADTALSVLPGHSLVLQGRAIEAVRLSALGSVGSIIVALLLVYPLSEVFSSCYSYLMKYIGIFLLGIALLMIKSERGPQIEGQGSLVHLKYKALASLLFATSGILGLFALNHQDLFQSPFGFEPQSLLPLLSGIFGASFLILSLYSESKIPEQTETEMKITLRCPDKIGDCWRLWRLCCGMDSWDFSCGGDYNHAIWYTLFSRGVPSIHSWCEHLKCALLAGGPLCCWQAAKWSGGSN